MMMGFLNVIVGISPLLWTRVPLEEESKDMLNRIVYAVMFFTLPAAFLKMTGDKNPYTWLLIYLLRHRYWLYAAILILALLPGLTAYAERRSHPDAASKCYGVMNMLYNGFGAAIAVAMLQIASVCIENLNILSLFYTEQIILIFIPVCFWIALFYQYEEQQEWEREAQNQQMDHDTSLKWKNQVLNILHLANIYFWVVVSALLMICYILYCHIHHVDMELTGIYLAYFSLALSFFHTIGTFVPRSHLYLLFLAAVPSILLFCIQWLSWFIISQKMQWCYTGFISLHLVAYLVIIARRERILWRLWNCASVVLCGGCVAYCCLTPMPSCLEKSYLWVFNLVLLLLYGLLYICLRDGRFRSCRLLLNAIPTVLICAALWVAGLAGDKRTLAYQSLFIATHSATYMLIVFLRETEQDREKTINLWRILRRRFSAAVKYIRNIRIVDGLKTCLERSPRESLEDLLKMLSSFLVMRNHFFMVVFVIMVIGYPIFCAMPFSLERVSYQTAENHIRALCDDGSRADALLAEIRDSKWYDDLMLEKPDIDQTQYLAFLWKNLLEELTDQIPGLEDSSDLTYDKLLNWYNSYQGNSY